MKFKCPRCGKILNRSKKIVQTIEKETGKKFQSLCGGSRLVTMIPIKEAK